MPQHATTTLNCKQGHQTPSQIFWSSLAAGAVCSVTVFSSKGQGPKPPRSSFLKRLHPVKGRKKSAAAAMTTTNIKHNTRVFSLTILLEEYLSLITLKPPKTSQNRFPVAPLQLSRTSQEEAQRIPVCSVHMSFCPMACKTHPACAKAASRNLGGCHSSHSPRAALRRFESEQTFQQIPEAHPQKYLTF